MRFSPSFRVRRRALLLLLALIVAVAATPACAVASDVDTANADLTFAPNVKGSVDGQVRTLTPQEVLALRFVSHEKILTWEGIIENFGKPNAEVHIIDTTKFDGHLGYTKNALGRGQMTEQQFFTEVMFPASRRYMPFLAFDFRTQPIEVNGKRFSWVMNMRRYNWRDDERQLADVLSNMRALLSERLMPGFDEPILFVYDMPGFIPGTQSLRRPHITQLNEIRNAGFDVITEGDMIAHAGGSLVSVLNPGLAFGFLKLVKSGDVGERLTPRHIAVFEDTPERVPPVAGIVTLEPQTPLSHVNLLAKNRGTPNVSTAKLSLIPSIEPLFGQMVKMVAAADGTIQFTSATEAEANAFFESRQQQALEVPQIEPLSLEPVAFATGDARSIGLPNIGSKASNYATIQKLLGPDLVRPGFALGFAHYKQLIAGSPAEPLIADLLATKNSLPPEEIDARLVAIRDAIQKRSPAAALASTVAAVRKIAAALGVARIRFRSSTNSEDLPVFNGAGLYESAGFDTADDDAHLVKDLLKVMASLWLERAYWERELFGIKHADVAMAILVNPAFSDEFANGVVVGSNAGGPFVSWVNAQKGEASVTNPLEGEVPESFTVSGPAEGVSLQKIDSRSNIGNVFLVNGAPTLDPLLVPQLTRLHAVTEQLHRHFVGERVAAGDRHEYAIDIEYKLMTEGGGTPKLFVKQSRLLVIK